MSSSPSPSSSPSLPVGTLFPPPSNSTPSTPSPPPETSPPPPTIDDSLPLSIAPPPPSASSPPPPATTSPPPGAAPPPVVTTSPPPPLLAPPPATPPPATLAPPTSIASPPPTSSPPANSTTQSPSPPTTDATPPPLSNPLSNSPPPPPPLSLPANSPPPPPPLSLPTNSPPPPPPLSNPPANSPPQPQLSNPPANSPPQPPPLSNPPANSPPPPPLSNPLANSPPPPPSIAPPNSAPPPPSPTTAPAPKEAAPPANTSDGSITTPTTTTLIPKTNQTTSPDSVINSGQSSSSSSSKGGNSNSGSVIAIAVLVAFIVVSLVGLAIWYIRKRRNKFAGYDTGFVLPDSSPFQSPLMSGSYGKSTSPPPPSLHKSASNASETRLSGSRSCFSYEELYDITDGFSPQNILGEGGFGCVYKGVLHDGRQVAVKQLKDGSGQGEREFKAEVEIISRIHHRHLVSLVGYCISEEHRLLVYDYVPNGTLESHLHGKGKLVMSWAIRVKVAVGSARGLAYLHEDCHPRIIHRDIKSSNILLDNNFEAQVADFGLARLAMDFNTHVTTRVMGTFGYLAPEYASSGKLTEKSDIFSFGVVLLELITGKKPVDSSRPLGDESLVEWARPMLSHALESGDFGELPDPRLEGNYNEAEMFRMIEAAAACVRHSAGMRPRMSKVVRVFDALADSDLNNGVAPGQSEAFHVAQSADIRLFQRIAFGSQEFSSDYSRSNWSRQSDT